MFGFELGGPIQRVGLYKADLHVSLRDHYRRLVPWANVTQMSEASPVEQGTVHKYCCHLFYSIFSRTAIVIFLKC